MIINDTLVIPENQTIIHKREYRENLSFSKVVLHDKVQKIESEAFAFCKRLQSINFPESMVFIGDNAFRQCEQIEDVDLKNVQFIGDASFTKCYKIKKIKITSNTKVLQSYVFRYCTSLEEVSIENGISQIFNDTFSYCNNLHSINIPESVQSIDNFAFLNCKNLRKIVFEGTSIDIHRYAFSGCDSLVEINHCNIEDFDFTPFVEYKIQNSIS